MTRIAFELILTLQCCPALAFGDKNKDLDEILIEFHKNSIQAVAISPSGKKAASADVGSKTVHLWTFPDGKKIGSLESNIPEEIRLIAFSPDGKEFAATSGGVLVQWDLEKTERIKKTKFLEKGKGPISAIAYSPDGTMLAVSAWDKVIIWDRSHQKSIQTWVHDYTVEHLAWSRDSKSLAGAMRDRSIRIWKLGLEKSTATLKGHGLTAAGVAFVDTDKSLASAGWDQKAIFWDLEKNQINKTFEIEQRASGIASSADGSILAIATFGKGVQLFDTKKAARLRTVHPSASISAIAISQDGKYLLLGYGTWLPTETNPNGRLAIVKVK